MKTLKSKFYLIITALILASCGGEPKNNSSNENSDYSAEDSFEQAEAKRAEKQAEAEKITKDLCDNFPKEMILKYNPDGERIEVEPVELTPGKLDHCKIKLFYGDRDYDFWEGRVSAYAPNMPKPLAQYKPFGGQYLKIDEFGDQAVYLSATYQLLIMKDGLVYNLVPPNDGSRTSTGKKTQEITMELARHYGLNN
jgi:hypothetical protein